MLPTYEVTLFLAATHFDGSARLAERELVEAISKRRLKILIIDDTTDFRQSMAQLLSRKYGAVVTDVEGGRAGIDLVKAGSIFNVIFLDLKMPDMDGLRTYAELRQSDVDCRIVIMSAHSGSPEWREAEESGLEVVTKPVPDETITSILGEL